MVMLRDLCFLDTETCGLTGPAVILQYAFNDDPEIHIHEFWRRPIQESLNLLDRIAKCRVVGFNLAFDWFQLQKMYNMLLIGLEDLGPDYHPEWADMDGWAQREFQAIDGPCFKPHSACDLMLHARKTKYQITMERSDIRIRRVPTPLAFALAKELEERVILSGILFARRKNHTAPRWAVYDVVRDGRTDPNFKDVVLKFKPSVALKALAHDALGEKEDDILKFADIEVDRSFWPKECKYAPYALSTGTPGHWNGAWPEVIEYHISHWGSHELARKYASKDVDYTRRLYKHFGSPECGDDDSILACAVASCRWHGYEIDIEGIKKLRAEEQAKLGKYPTAPGRAKEMLMAKLDATERAVLLRGTGKMILEEITKWDKLECPFGPCEACNETGIFCHPAAEVAKGILEARKAVKRIELYTKLIHAKQLHASFKVIGTLSSRMSGTDDLNPQGIPHSKDVRGQFPLASLRRGTKLRGGDFDAFEVTLADAAYNDEGLRKDLLTKAICPGCLGSGTSKGKECGDCKGKGEANQKIHALFAMSLFPGKSYRDIVLSKGNKDLDMYDLGKRGVFALVYGGNANTLVTKLGVTLEVAENAERLFTKKYPGVGIARAKVFDMFCSMRQVGGIGSRVVWNEPAEYIESLFGFRRYFVLENQICKVLFGLANNPPKEWKSIKIRVIRRDREQTAVGALQSALYAAAFGVQAANMRAAANHVIQSSGATVTKRVQRRVWDVQPEGCSEWLVQPMNIHDEILCPTKDDEAIHKQVEDNVYEVVEHFKKRVPLMGIGWQTMSSWAEK